MSNSAYQLPTVIVHTVHGTWPFGLWRAIIRRQLEKTPCRTDYWFLDGSDFQFHVTGLVERRVKWVTFRWSGRNSFAARHLAATQLSNHLSTWFRRCPDAEHVIIAHSHGGSVSIAAARQLEERGVLTKRQVVRA
jgi:hypothetical protein